MDRFRKTKLMARVEDQFERSLEALIPELVNEHGLTDAAALMGISKAGLGYWMLKMGITIQRVAVPADVSIQVVKK